MKSKKSLYLLLPLVALIWGLIIYRIIQYTHPTTDNFDPRPLLPLVQDTITYPKQTKLLLNYADPFLKILSTEKCDKNPSEFASLFQNNPEPVLKEADWPVIAYKGMVKNGHDPLGIIEIDNKKTLVSNGSQLENLIVAKVYNDSIVISLDKKTKTFYKK
jgi:hypothetical protein